MKSDLVDIVVEIKGETALAVRVRSDDRKQTVWLPKSLIEIERGKPSAWLATITLSLRLAEEKGLV